MSECIWRFTQLSCRPKSPAERAGKRNQSSPIASSNSEEQQPALEMPTNDQLNIEEKGFRARLHELVSRERDRLLGVSAATTLDDLW